MGVSGICCDRGNVALGVQGPPWGESKNMRGIDSEGLGSGTLAVIVDSSLNSSSESSWFGSAREGSNRSGTRFLDVGTRAEVTVAWGGSLSIDIALDFTGSIREGGVGEREGGNGIDAGAGFDTRGSGSEGSLSIDCSEASVDSVDAFDRPLVEGAAFFKLAAGAEFFEDTERARVGFDSFLAGAELCIAFCFASCA